MTRGMEILARFFWLAVLTRTVSASIHVVVFWADWDRTSTRAPSMLSGPRLAPAVDMALSDIWHRVDSGQYANFSLNVTYSPTGCAGPTRDAVGISARLYFRSNLSAIFGPSCSSSALVVGDLAATLNLPMVSFLANDHNLDDKDRYTTLTQTSFKSTKWCPLFLDFCRRYNWKTIVLLRTVGSFYILPSNSLEDCLREAEIKSTVIYLDWYPGDAGRALQEAASYSRSK